MKILSIGDLLLDILVRYDPLSGEADTGPEGVQIWPGGSAANFAVQAARLGMSEMHPSWLRQFISPMPEFAERRTQEWAVRFAGRVGRDWAGDMLVRSLEAEGVTTSVRVIAEEPSGRVLVMVDPTGHRRMWSYPGASRTISTTDLDPAWFDGLDAFHLTGYSLLREEPELAALVALRMARAQGSPLCTLDPNPPHLIAAYGPARFREMLAELRFDVIFPNLEEGRLLTGREAPTDVATNLLDASPVVALTLGADGCLVATDEGVLAAKAEPVVAVDATGAGDAFAAAFVVEYLRNRDARAAALAANRLAAVVVSRPGGR